ncbi:MAG: DUF4043 family protein [Pseudomonadota bacterium]
MAVTSYGVNDPLAVKVWSKRLSIEVLKNTWASRFMGTSSASVIQIKDELQKGSGDKITYGLRMQLSGTGVLGDGTLEGNEESLTTYSDAVILYQLRHAVRSAGRMSQQRVPFNIRDEALSACATGGPTGSTSRSSTRSAATRPRARCNGPACRRRPRPTTRSAPATT